MKRRNIVEALYSLFDITGEEKYLDFAVHTPFDGRFIDMEPVSNWKQTLYQMQDPTEDSPEARFKSKVHTYHFFEKCISQLEYYQHLKDSSLLIMPEYAFAKMTDNERPGMFISGATGRSEGWVEDQKGTGGIGEACFTTLQYHIVQIFCQIIHCFWTRHTLFLGEQITLK